jgi:hypothetical protein
MLNIDAVDIRVPPNCRFEVDDAELEWTYPVVRTRPNFNSALDTPDDLSQNLGTGLLRFHPCAEYLASRFRLAAIARSSPPLL